MASTAMDRIRRNYGVFRAAKNLKPDPSNRSGLLVGGETVVNTTDG